jgi:hypothetical protein
LQVTFEDDGFSPAKALAAVKKLLEQGHVFMIFGLSGSNQSSARSTTSRISRSRPISRSPPPRRSRTHSTATSSAGQRTSRRAMANSIQSSSHRPCSLSAWQS